VTYRLLDLFSGIGGFSLGLERSGGFKTVAFCEVEPFCTKILNKHWPEVPVYGDVRELTAKRLAADGIGVDAICGGFPCQDISTAGKGAGIEGERSGLWSEYARLIGELRPRYVFVENVAALLGRGLDRVLGDLAALGYDAEWHCIPASAVGAPHQRDRIWIMAHSRRGSWGSVRSITEREDTQSKRPAGPNSVGGSGKKSQIVADANSQGLQGRAQAGDIGSFGSWLQQFIERRSDDIGAAWKVEPDVGRLVNGVPARVDRLKALGNAVVPQIPELLGRAVLRAEGRAA
jgi:DNA (cytosine-5)-methyltransferase 1